MSFQGEAIRGIEEGDVDQDKKRELRQLKREIKRAGGKRRRRMLKQGLAEHPEDAHDDSPGFGKFRSADLNGIDRTPSRTPTDEVARASKEGWNA